MASYYDYLLLFLLILPLLIIVKSKSKSLSRKLKYKLPPGPWNLPIVGSIHHLIGRGLPHHALHDLSQQYGGLMFLQVGENPTVVVSSIEGATEIMKTHDLKFCTRPINPAFKILTYDGKDIALAPYGKYWQEMRKICALELLSPKQVQSFRSIREEEVKSLINHISLASSSKQVVDLSSLLYGLVNDVTLRAIMGSKSKDQDLILGAIKTAADISTEFNIGNMFPSSRLASMFTGALHRAKQFRLNIDRLFERIIREHRKKEPERDGHAEDLLGILLRLYDERSQDNLISMDSIKAVIFDLIAAGTETLASPLAWAMAELIKNPGVMEKAQTEIRKKLQGHESPTMSDVVDLEVIHQIIKETMRLHTPSPLLMPRECQETCNILGYDIPKGTTVIINAWSLARNSNYWEDVEKFKPERFAKVEGNVQSDREDFKFIPFGAGRRKCPGVLFGSAIIELVLTNLLYRFDWELPDGMSPDELDMTEAFGVTASRKSPLLLRAIPYQY